MRNWFKVFELPKEAEKNEELDRIDPILISEFTEFCSLPRYQASLIAMYCRLKQKGRSVKTNDFLNAAQEEFASSIAEQGLEALIAKNWLRTFSDGTFSFEEGLRLTHHVEVALRKSKKELLPLKVSNDPFKELRGLHAVACSIRRGNRSVLEWPDAIERTIRKRNSVLRQFLRRKDITTELLHIGLFVTVLNALESSSVDINVVLYAFAPDPLQRLVLSNKLLDPTNGLIEKGILEMEDGFRGEKSLKATREFLGTCVPGHGLLKPSFSHACAKLIPHQTIDPVPLLYNADLSAQLNKINALCEIDVFPQFVHQLQGQSCKGIIAQFHGEPGSGKTEFCYQLARQTKRDLLLFDVSQTRNKYYGETEKAIKSLFDAYRQEVSRSNAFPILLFNEGDSIFQNRTEGEQNSSQTENIVQTILLNELERFEGILLITTNKPNLFDSAFNRRFLFKLSFGYPDYDVRKALLKLKFPGLTPTQVDDLASQFHFSAAELNNFTKQRLIDTFCAPDTRSVFAGLTEFLKFLSVPNRNIIKGYIQYSS
jgi:hypothetical protein